MLKSDSKSILLLACLILGCVALFFIVDRGVGDNSPEIATIDTLVAHSQDSFVDESPTIAKSLHPFDPNTADSNTLLSLGLPSWMVKGMLKYRAKGGVYSSPEDFARVPGLTVKQYKELLPYIVIGDDYKPASTLVGERRRDDARWSSESSSSSDDGQTPNYPRQEKMQPTEQLSINAADTNALKRVPGIGSYFARKIVEKREKLGGFVSLNQLLEIKNFPESALSYFTIPDGGVKKINVNTASFKTLSAHPLIGYQRTKTIFDYRRLKGRITSMPLLVSLLHYTPEEAQLLSEYIEF